MRIQELRFSFLIPIFGRPIRWDRSRHRFIAIFKDSGGHGGVHGGVHGPLIYPLVEPLVHKPWRATCFYGMTWELQEQRIALRRHRMRTTRALQAPTKFVWEVYVMPLHALRSIA